jgi:hypothetical protein
MLHLRITIIKEVRIRTLERRLRTTCCCRRYPRGRPPRSRRDRRALCQTVRLLRIAVPDRESLVPAIVRDLRAGIVLVVAAACYGALEVGEGGASNGEGLGCVACAGYLLAVSLGLISEGMGEEGIPGLLLRRRGHR